MHPSSSSRERIAVATDRGTRIALQCQQATHGDAIASVIYVHGATFGADLSVFFGFDDGRSWADELADSGFAVWGFDFVGYGASSRYPPDLNRPAGDWRDALRDLHAVVGAVRQRNGGQPVALLAHSRGAAVAARFAGDFAEEVAALVLFAPVAPRAGAAPAPRAAPLLPSHQPLSAWAQYRRFIEDVPRGHPQVLSEAHMQRWSELFLASDPTSATRSPPSVMTPCGPLADIAALWSGHAWYDPARIVASTLLVRGEWDSVCNDDDAARLMSQLGAPLRRDVKIARATHLMHLEQQRAELYAQVNRFLLQGLR